MKIIKYSIISKTVQAMPIAFAVKIVQLKFYIIFSQFDDLALHPRSLLCLKLDNCLTCAIIAISRTVFNPVPKDAERHWDVNLILFLCKLWHSNNLHDGTLMHRIYAHARVDDSDPDARSQWASEGNRSVLNYLDD